MRRRSILAAAVAVVAICAATAVLVTRNDEPAPPRPATDVSLKKSTKAVKDGGLIGRYAITVTDPAGNVQEATFTCATSNTSTGYLARRGTFEACRTAIADFDVVDYLDTGKRPPTDCDAVQQVTHAGWRYVITGEALNSKNEYKPINQELTVRTKCDEALWQQMKAMLPDS